MADIKLSGHADLAKLMAKLCTWNPPKSFDRYLKLLGQVILTSRYKGMYKELDPRDLQGQLRIKTHRCLRDGELDLKEVVDVGAYAGLLFMRMTPDDKPEVRGIVRTVGSTVEVGTPKQMEQVNKPALVSPPAKTENCGYLVGLKCPKCHSLEPFEILSTSTLCVGDTRIEQPIAATWTNKSPCCCVRCGHCSGVRSFRVCKPAVKKAVTSK